MKLKLRISRDIPQSKSSNKRRLNEDSMVSLRAYRRERIANRMLPHQPKAA